jgi:hypothetical protein
MSIKIDALASGPFTIAAGGSGGGSLSAINNGTIGIQSGDTVQGRMVSVEKTYSIDEIERLGLNTLPHAYHDRIKTELIELLMAKIIQSKCVEFTKQDNFMENSVKFRARMFVTPDDMVRFIRKNVKGYDT